MKRQNMDQTLNTGNESAPFAPKSYSTSSNLQRTHTQKKATNLLCFFWFVWLALKRGLQIGELTKSLTGGLMITKTTQRPTFLYSDLKSVRLLYLISFSHFFLRDGSHQAGRTPPSSASQGYTGTSPDLSSRRKCHYTLITTTIFFTQIEVFFVYRTTENTPCPYWLL